MASETLAPPPADVARAPRQSPSSWPLMDRSAYYLCWLVGIGLCVIAVAIVLYMFVKGIAYLRLGMLFESPAPSQVQSQSGGILDPIEGTLIVGVLGTAIAAPVGVGIAAWLTEYGRPYWLARTVESSIEIMSGAPSVVLALFGLLIFAQSFLGFLSQTAANGSVYGRSFFAASAVMAVLAIPMVVGSTKEGLTQLPDRLREASYALGRTRITTIRRVLLPAVKPNIATGTVLGMGRIIGDTAIIRILLGVSLTTQSVGHVPVLGVLRGTGSTLTTYVYENSPAGEGTAPQKAYAAAFLLLLMILALNAVVTWIANRGARDEPRKRGSAFMLLRFSGAQK